MLFDLLLIASLVIMLAWYPCCPAVLPGYAVCTYCIASGNNAPQYVTVVLAGSADDDCTNCEAYDGTYVVEWSTTCQWYKAYAESECGSPITGKDVWIIIYGDGSGGTPYYIWGRFAQTWLSDHFYYFKSTEQAAKFDCLSPDEEYTLSYTSEQIGGLGGSGNKECDMSSATLTVSFGDNS